MIYVLAALLPPLGLLLNGQPFSAIFNLVLIVFCADFRADFPRPAAGAVGACADRGPHEAGGRRHREVVEAIRQHGPPPGYPR